MDNAVKILADFIVDDKTAVIVFLKEEGYADLPLDAPFMEVNEAVSKHILDENFVKKLSNVIFPFRGVIPASAQVAAESTQAGSSANPATWVVKVVEIGANLFIQAKSEENERLATYAQYDLAQRQLRDQTEIAKIKAQEDFAFDAALRLEFDSSDKVELICAFLFWAGYVRLRKVITRHLEKGRSLRILTTTYCRIRFGDRPFYFFDCWK